MWKLMTIMDGLLTFLSLLYLSGRTKKFSCFRCLEKKRAYILSILSVASVMLALFLSLGSMNYFICIGFTVAIWLICDLISFIARKTFTNRPIGKGRYYAGMAALIISFCYLSYCAYNASHGVATHYDINTDKINGDLRIVQISDAHIGTLFDGDQFGEYIDAINATLPDLFVVTGDFVDDSTEKEDMLKACDQLGRIKAKYGVYFVFGNHDLRFFSQSSKGWTNDAYIAALKKNNVHILLDDSINLTEEICLCGRIDSLEASRNNGRMSVASLLEQSNRKNRFTIVLDHQPHEYDDEAEQGVDLVLSGHTHGGQLFPFNELFTMGGINDQVYGLEKRKNTSFIVSSGIGDWSILFRSGCPSEYVVIDIHGK